MDTKNLQSQTTIKHLAASAIAAGEFYVAGSLRGYAHEAIASGDIGNLEIAGQAEVTKNAGEAWTIGQKAYYDSTDSNFTTTEADNEFAGIITDIAESAAVLGRVLFNTVTLNDSGNVIGSYIWVSKDGDDTEGNGTINKPYLTVTQAFSVITNTRKTVMLMPGEYEEAAVITWPNLSGVVLTSLLGKYATIIKGASDADQVISISPTFGSTFEAWINNIYIDHDTSGQDGILIDNADMTAKMLIYLQNFGADGSSSDKSIITSHAYASEAIRIYADGDNGGVSGDIYLDIGNNGDRAYFTGMSLSGGCETSADATVAAFKFINCWDMPENASITGGNAAQTALFQGSFSDAPAIINNTDTSGSQTETIIGS